MVPTMRRVYKENSVASARPIEGVATAVPAFIGFAASGPFNKPTLVANWAQYRSTFGDGVEGTYLGRTVHAYFNNGGGACYVVRMRSDVVTANPPRGIELTTGLRLPTGSDSVVGEEEVVSGPASDVGTRRDDVEPASRIGVDSLEDIDEITMVCAPDLMTAFQGGFIDLESLTAAQEAMISHCERMGDRVAILDAPPGMTASQVVAWRIGDAGFDSGFAAIYWPWLKSLNPVTGKIDFMPPCGHVAGIWARVDRTRGVHASPGNEVANGAIDVEVRIGREEGDFVDSAGINVLMHLPGRGIRATGACTLSGDPLWSHTNIRRLVNYIEKSILNGTDWVKLQANDESLWDQLANSIAGFLISEWRKGALSGGQASQAYYVKCDEDTNPPASIAAGELTCEIGLAPRPNSFVVFRLSKFAGGLSTVSEFGLS
jgi:phage tail sheath protein FI